jgi:tetratricopeptide (TPR) repeat protein
MRRSFLYTGLRKTGQAFLLLGTVFLFACTDAADRDSAALRKDQESIAQLSRIKTVLDSTKTVQPQDFATVKRILEKYPAAREARSVYRDALVVRKDWEVLEEFLRQTPLEKLSDEDRRTLGSVHIRNGKYEDAVAVLGPLAGKNAADIESQTQLALAEYHLGLLDEAAARLDSVRDRLISEKRAGDLALRGIIHLAKNELPAAETVLKTALEQAPDNSTVTNALSQVYARSGNAAEAERFRQKTLEINDKYAADQYRAYRSVEQVYDLENAWKSKNYGEVIRLANAMLATADRNRKAVLLQYIAESNKALGNAAEAQKALAELQNLQKQQ